jgi:hypothetical protein
MPNQPRRRVEGLSNVMRFDPQFVVRDQPLVAGVD